MVLFLRFYTFVMYKQVFSMYKQYVVLELLLVIYLIFFLSFVPSDKNQGQIRIIHVFTSSQLNAIADRKAQGMTFLKDSQKYLLQ